LRTYRRGDLWRVNIRGGTWRRSLLLLLLLWISERDSFSNLLWI
jgi:hypothetical protein